MRLRFDGTPAGRGVLILCLFLGLALPTACEDGPTDPGLGFVDGGGTPSDTAGPPADGAAPDDVAADDSAETPDVPEDTGGPCFEAPGVVLPVAAGVLSSYSRGAANPSIRQWSDRARFLGYRGVVFADHQRRTENAPRIDQFTDSNPNYPYQFVFIWDDTFTYEQQGDGALATPIETYGALEIQRGSAAHLRGAEGGWARATHDADPPFDYDVQDLALQVRVACPDCSAGARVTISYVYKVRQNAQRFTWVFYGDPGDDNAVTDIGPDVQPLGATFRSYQLPLKQQIIDREGAIFWTEGVLTQVELRVEGDADVVFDEVRLNVDARFDDYTTELAKYAGEANIVFVPGIEHYFDSEIGQFDCVAPNVFPGTDATPADGLFAAFDSFGCLTVADRPWAQGAGAPDSSIRQADAVEVWHPSYSENGGLLVDRWDALLLAGVPIVGLASTFARDVGDLTKTSPQNHVLAASATREDVVAALAAGRLYLTEDIAVRASFWAERPECQRAEMGDTVADAVALHVEVRCPNGVADARLVHFAAGSGTRTEHPLEGAGTEAIVDIAGWSAGHVRLEATCESGARVVSNPIWLAN